MKTLSRFLSFNSTLVQLKVISVILRSVVVDLFQFYLSSIKRNFGENSISLITMFQFYLSSIKRPYLGNLEQDANTFQFYLSSIKSI